MSLVGLLDAIEARGGAGEAGGGVRLGVAFCTNHHAASEVPMIWHQSTLKSGIKAIGQTAMLAAPWDEPRPLKRSWCLLELQHSISVGNKISFVQTPKESEALDEALQADMENVLKKLEAGGPSGWRKGAETSVEAQKAAVDQAVARNEGGFDELFNKLLEQLHRWVLGRAKALLKTLEPEARRASNMVDHIAKLLQDFGELEEAEPLCREVVEARKAKLGANHADTIEAVNNHAMLLHHLGKLEDAEPLEGEARLVPPHARRPPPRHDHGHRHALAAALRPRQARHGAAAQARVARREAAHARQQAPRHAPLGQQPRRAAQRPRPLHRQHEDAAGGRAAQARGARGLPRGLGQPPPAYARLGGQPRGHAHAARSADPRAYSRRSRSAARRSRARVRCWATTTRTPSSRWGCSPRSWSSRATTRSLARSCAPRSSRSASRSTGRPSRASRSSVASTTPTNSYTNEHARVLLDLNKPAKAESVMKELLSGAPTPSHDHTPCPLRRRHTNPLTRVPDASPCQACVRPSGTRTRRPS